MMLSHRTSLHGAHAGPNARHVSLFGRRSTVTLVAQNELAWRSGGPNTRHASFLARSRFCKIWRSTESRWRGDEEQGTVRPPRAEIDLMSLILRFFFCKSPSAVTWLTARPCYSSYELKSETCLAFRLHGPHVSSFCATNHKVRHQLSYQRSLA